MTNELGNVHGNHESASRALPRRVFTRGGVGEVIASVEIIIDNGVTDCHSFGTAKNWDRGHDSRLPEPSSDEYMAGLKSVCPYGR